jgi:two-component system response regulator HydG
VERALVLAESDVLQPTDLPPLTATNNVLVDTSAAIAATAFPSSGLDLTAVVEGVEAKMLRDALAQARGVKAEAARLLGLKPSALYYKLEKYGIEA